MPKMGGLKTKKIALLGFATFILLGIVAGLLYASNSANRNSQKPEPATDNKTAAPNVEQLNAGEVPEGIEVPTSIYEGYKKQIAENKARGAEKAILYLNAAVTGARVRAPEAPGYAKEALNLLPKSFRDNEKNKELITELEKIANGTFEVPETTQ